MTALIYKAALPTYTSLEELNANAGESLLLNDAGTAYELEPAQSGATVLPAINISSYVDGAPQSGAGGVLVPGFTAMGGPNFNAVTLSYGPVKVGAGGKLSQWFIRPGISAEINMELFVSNAAGTQSMLVYQAGQLIVLTEGVIKTMDQASWATPTSLVGADLSIVADGSVQSAAGGVFWVTLYAYMHA